MHYNGGTLFEFKGQPGVIMRSMHEYIDRTTNNQIFGLVGQDEMDATGMFGNYD